MKIILVFFLVLCSSVVVGQQVVATTGGTLRVGKENLSGLLYLLYDLSGRLLTKKVIENIDTTVPFQSLQSGSYLLEVLDGKLGLMTFKIIKQ